MLATHSDIMFQHGAYGDKDQFRLAFALSGNSDSYYQVGQPDFLQMHTVQGLGPLCVHTLSKLQQSTSGG